MMFSHAKWYRTDRNKQIAGVCAGVAEVYGLPARRIRMFYTLALLCGIPMFLVYLLQWMIYPKR
ncbi:DNA-binding transcriptional activator PspC [Corynebacterium ciconiae DSM 44920]|uniref:PspC domain-containing protein n=1 Tax=Corynebacterium ciconiae TaxID=227319 RepID=UPI000370B340|nr:PspC domain-containing protein [Corynebacterium ciconiae]WKD60151.1 DNA-binding transcriptional activator PspC [Corynebacterium ciconiae DSM 44920]